MRDTTTFTFNCNTLHNFLDRNITNNTFADLEFTHLQVEFLMCVELDALYND